MRAQKEAHEKRKVIFLFIWDFSLGDFRPGRFVKDFDRAGENGGAKSQKSRNNDGKLFYPLL